MYVWIKAWHVIFVVTWFAGLFYLPRLFVYHAMSEDSTSIERFKVMERKLYHGIMMPSLVLTLAAGFWLLWLRGWDWLSVTTWIQVKLVLVALLVVYHFYLGHLRKRFLSDSNVHGHVFYRWLNEAPVIVLIAGVCLAIVKPWSG